MSNAEIEVVGPGEQALIAEVNTVQQWREKKDQSNIFTPIV